MLALALQPDAGQASAVGAAVVFIGLSQRGWTRWILGAVPIGIVFLAWSRPDALPAVPHVEGILRLAWAKNRALGAIALATLAILPVVYARAWWQHRAADSLVGRVAASLGVYTVGTIVASLVGNFPVPVMGYGASPILGSYLAIGLLQASRNSRVVQCLR